MTGAGPGPAPRPLPAALEVVEDRTAATRPDEGFLRVRRLVLRTVWADGTRSAPYACDIVSRARTDAVAVAVFEVRRGPDGRRRPWALLKTGMRPPLWLRRGLALAHPDEAEYGVIAEVVAGMLEPDDAGPSGVERRAAEECREEAGLAVDPGSVRPLGGPSFPSPGITDEKVHYRCVEADLDRRGLPEGDGSGMEEGGGVAVLPLADAVAACRSGEVPDMKTEVALLRLCDALGYLPGLDCFVEDLPPALREAWRPPGLAAPRDAP